MDSVGESSSTQLEGDKPVIVRVKRKIGQSPVDAFWLEINDRPYKRQLLDFSKLSISNSKEKVTDSSVEEVGYRMPKKVLVRHLETVKDDDTTPDVINSFFKPNVNEDHSSSSKEKSVQRRIAFKKDNKKEQRLTKAVQHQQIARFEQIWRSRKGMNLQDKCSFYDVIRVDTEECKPKTEPEEVMMSLEDQRMMASFLPLLREHIPTAVEEIEDDIMTRSNHNVEEFVYDYYAVNEEMDTSEESYTQQFPLVQVQEEEDFYFGPDESDYDSQDSNAEDHPNNDYPEEIFEEEEEEEKESGDSSEKEEEEDDESSERYVRELLDEVDSCCAAEEVYNESDEEFYI